MIKVVYLHVEHIHSARRWFPLLAETTDGYYSVESLERTIADGKLAMALVLDTDAKEVKGLILFQIVEGKKRLFEVVVGAGHGWATRLFEDSEELLRDLGAFAKELHCEAVRFLGRKAYLKTLKIAKPVGILYEIPVEDL